MIDIDPLVVFLIALVALFILGSWVIPYYRIKHATLDVVAIFQQHGAISEKTARWPHEIGLGIPTTRRTLFRTRDYKSQATDVLIRAGLLAVCDDGKIFLVLENLAKSSLYTGRGGSNPTKPSGML